MNQKTPDPRLMSPSMVNIYYLRLLYPQICEPPIAFESLATLLKGYRIFVSRVGSMPAYEHDAFMQS